MKFKNLFLGCIALSCFFIASCSKDDDNNSSTPTKYSDLTVEQNKAKVEDNGIAMLNSVKEIESNQAIGASANMFDFISKADMFINNPNMASGARVSQFNEMIKPVSAIAKSKSFNVKGIANEMMVKLEPTTLVDMWNSVKGTYTWNSSTSTWSFTAGNEIKLLFPSTETGTTNNVSFRVYDFLYENGPFSWTEDYTGELPKQIKMELKVGNDVVLTYSLVITYENADKKPNSITSTLGLPPFKFTAEVTNNKDSEASVSYNLTKNETTTLMSFSLSAKGNWSESNLSQANLEPGNVIYNGNATFQLMNIKVVGNVDVKNLNVEMNGLSDKLGDLQEATAESDIINKNASLALCYADNNLIIAKVIAYPQQFTDTYWDYYLNKEVTETGYDVGIKFKFKDDSTVDYETYFGQGFDKLVDEAIEYLNYIEGKY